MAHSLARLSKEDIEEAKLTIWDRLTRGESDDEIVDLLGLEVETYRELKLQIIDDKAQELRAKPSEHVYVEYVINQCSNINDLTEMIATFKRHKQYNALVGAVRARADLYDRLIAKGQEFGVFRKTAERREIVKGILVADMTSVDLKAAITSELSKLSKMMKTYGDSDILDVIPDTIHYGPKLKPSTGDSEGEKSAIVVPPGKKKKASKTVRARTSKTSKSARGRRPFKEP